MILSGQQYSYLLHHEKRLTSKTEYCSILFCTVFCMCIIRFDVHRRRSNSIVQLYLSYYERLNIYYMNQWYMDLWQYFMLRVWLIYSVEGKYDGTAQVLVERRDANPHRPQTWPTRSRANSGGMILRDKQKKLRQDINNSPTTACSDLNTLTYHGMTSPDYAVQDRGYGADFCLPRSSCRIRGYKRTDSVILVREVTERSAPTQNW